MDSQPISPVNGSASGSQGQVQLPASTSGKSVQAAEAAPAPAPAPIEVRMRDPRSLQYQVDSGTKQIVATIVDENNQMVVVQIPNEEVLRIARAIDRMKGFLLEGKA